MSMTTSIHRVVKISADQKAYSSQDCPKYWFTTITFTDSKGEKFEHQAYSDKPLCIDGAELLNFAHTATEVIEVS